MAKRRRSRGFGSSAAEHVTHAERSAGYMTEAAESAIRETDAGRCSAAVLSLQDAFVRMGQRQADYRGAGRNIPAFEKAEMAVQRARDHFRQHCLIPRR
jgi:hypothetical protein